MTIPPFRPHTTFTLARLPQAGQTGCRARSTRNITNEAESSYPGSLTQIFHGRPENRLRYFLPDRV